MKIAEVKTILSLLEGFQKAPLWLKSQTPIDFSPKFKAALMLLADFYGKRYFHGQTKIDINNPIPYFLSPEESQLAEIHLVCELGPLRTNAFVDQLILAFTYCANIPQLAMLLGGELNRLDLEFYLQKHSEAPSNHYLHTLFPVDFLQEKALVSERLPFADLLSLLRSSTAQGELPCTQVFYTEIQKRLLISAGIQFEEAKKDKTLAYQQKDILLLRRYSALTTGILAEKSLTCVRYLLDHHYPFLLAEDTDLFNALTLRGQTDLLERCFQESPIAPYQLAQCPFLLPVAKNDTEMIRCLLRLGFRLDRQSDPSTPLFLALTRHLDESASLLSQNQAQLGFAFAQGFGGGVLPLELLPYQARPDLSFFSKFLEEVSHDLILDLNHLREQYRFEERLFTNAYLDLCEAYQDNQGLLVYGEVECIFWVLATFDDFRRHQIHFSKKPLQPESQNLLELFWMDLNQLLLEIIQHQQNPDILKKTLIELGRRQEYSLLDWRALLPLCLKLPSAQDFDLVLQHNTSFFQFRDEYFPKDYLAFRSGLVASLEQRSPALYLAAHSQWDFLEILLKRQSDLIYWQSKLGDSLFSLALMEQNSQFCRILLRHGASLTLSLEIAIGENNLFLITYLLSWLWRHKSQNQETLYQELLQSGLDYSALLKAAKGQKRLLAALLGWLTLFPDNLRLFKSTTKDKPLSHLELADLKLGLGDLERLILEELENPNHRTLAFAHPKVNAPRFLSQLHDGWAPSFLEDLKAQGLKPPRLSHRAKALAPWQSFHPGISPDGHRLAELDLEGNLLLVGFFGAPSQKIPRGHSRLLTAADPAELSARFFDKGRRLLLISLSAGFECWNLKTLALEGGASPLSGMLESFHLIGEDRLLLHAEGEVLLWNLLSLQQEHHWKDPSLLWRPLDYAGELLTLDEGSPALESLHQDRPFYHIYRWSTESGQPFAESPCPHQHLLLPKETHLGQPLVFFEPTQFWTSPLSLLDPNNGEISRLSLESPFRLIQVEPHNHLTLLALSDALVCFDPKAKETQVLHQDMTFLHAGFFGMDHHWIILVFAPDPFRDRPGFFQVLERKTQKTLLKRDLKPDERILNLHHPEVFAIVGGKVFFRLFHLPGLVEEIAPKWMEEDE